MHVIFFLPLLLLGVVGVEVDPGLLGESDLDPDLIQERIVLVLEKKKKCVKKNVKEKRKEKGGGKESLPLKKDVSVVN